jgi:hypothetical protein
MTSPGGAAGSGLGLGSPPKKKKPKSTGSGGGSIVTGGSGGGGISSGSTGRYSLPGPPPPSGPGPVPNIQEFLGGDSGYQQQLRQLDKTFADFLADVLRRQRSLESEFGLSTKAMGDQKLKDLEAMEDDFASRGLIKSGLYADAVGDYNTEFGQRMSDLQRRQNEAIGQLGQERSQMKSQTELQKQAAREDAISRRAQKYGI